MCVFNRKTVQLVLNLSGINLTLGKKEEKQMRKERGHRGGILAIFGQLLKI